MTEVLEIYGKVSAIGFGGLLFVILAGSYFDKWCWSRDRDRALAAAKEDRDDWRRIALQSLSGMEKSSDYAVRIAAQSPPLGLGAIIGRPRPSESPPNGGTG